MERSIARVVIYSHHAIQYTQALFRVAKKERKRIYFHRVLWFEKVEHDEISRLILSSCKERAGEKKKKAKKNYSNDEVNVWNIYR